MKEYLTGIQLYSIREALKQDFKGVCRELVKLGCDGVEPAFYFGDMEPEELAAFFKEIGMKVCGIHAHFNQVTDPENEIYRYCRALNSPYITFSYGGEASQKDYKIYEVQTAELLNQASLAALQNGMKVTYHNHYLELVPYPDNSCGLDHLIRNTSPENTGFELDVYWVKKGGQDPAAYIQKNAARIWQLHMKDMAEDGSITELGNGNVDLKKCIEAAENAPCKWLIYEQDYSQKDPFESAVISIGYLNKLLNK